MNLELIKNLTTVNQNQLSKILYRFLKDKGYTNIKKNEFFILAEGDLPICLIAHMDTVFKEPQRMNNFIYDQERHILWGVGGTGFDDRAGIAAIIEVLEHGFRPHILFTNYEESGGIGADELVKRYTKWPFKTSCHALVELDRANEKDAVFYSCENYDFMKYIESFGFKFDVGTFTDISIIMKVWKIVGVNLSVGYEFEHSPNELLHLDWLDATIEKVEKILSNSSNMKHYKYIPYQIKPKVHIKNDECLICGTPLNEFNSQHIYDEEFPYCVCSSCYKQYYLTDETPFDF